MVEKIPLSILVIILFVLFISSAPASAIRVEGANCELNVSPGSNFSHTITVSQPNSHGMTDVQVLPLGYGINLNGAVVKLTSDEDTSPYSARTFLKITPQKILHLNGSEPQSVLLEGHIPTDVGAGGRYALVEVSTIPNNDSRMVSVIESIIVPVKLTILGTELVTTGKITNIKKIEFNDETSLIMTFENTGNYHYRSYVDVVITDENGQSLVNASTQSVHLIPGFSVALRLPLDGYSALPLGTYQASATMIRDDGTVLDNRMASIDIIT